jgi:hypothetical protein
LLQIFTLVATIVNPPHQATNRIRDVQILVRCMANKSLLKLLAAFPQLLTIHQAHSFWPLSHNTITLTLVNVQLATPRKQYKGVKLKK